MLVLTIAIHQESSIQSRRIIIQIQPLLQCRPLWPGLQEQSPETWSHILLFRQWHSCLQPSPKKFSWQAVRIQIQELLLSSNTAIILLSSENTAIIKYCYHTAIIKYCYHTAIIRKYCYHQILLSYCYHQIRLSYCYHQKKLLSSKVGKEFGIVLLKNLVWRDQLSNVFQINIFQEDGRLKWKQKMEAHSELGPRGNVMF